MYLEIVTPEAVIFEAEIEAVKVPGKNGEFQMLDKHAPIVATLNPGKVQINLAISSNRELLDRLNDDFNKEQASSNVLFYTIKGGVLEYKDNKAIILAD